MPKFLSGKAFGLLLVALFLISILRLSLIPAAQAQPVHVNRRIEDGPDDGFWHRYSTGEIWFWPDTPGIQMLLGENQEVYDWFRFVDVPIPHGAWINWAYLHVSAYADYSGDVIPYAMQGFDEDNALAPTSAADWNGRPKTDAEVSWNLPDFVHNDQMQSPDISDIIQEIVDRSDWSSGNALVVCSSAIGGTLRVCNSFDGVGVSTLAPSLSLSYSIKPRDVAVTNLELSTTEVEPGEDVSIWVTVENQGEVPETFEVTTYYDDTIIGTPQNVALIALGTQLLTFEWDTTGVTEGDYTIRAEATQVPAEIDLADNIRMVSPINVIPEFPAAIITPFLLVLTLVVAFILSKKASKKRSPSLPGKTEL